MFANVSRSGPDKIYRLLKIVIGKPRIFSIVHEATKASACVYERYNETKVLFIDR